MNNFLKSTSLNVAVRLLGSGLSLILSIYLARLLSVEVFGEYSFYLSLFMTLSILTSFGVNNLIIREVSSGSLEQPTEVVKWSLKTTMFVAVVVSITLICCLYIGLDTLEGNKAKTFLSGLPIIFLIPIVGIFISYIRAVDKPLVANSLELIPRPVLIILGLGTLSILFGGKEIVVSDVLKVFSSALFIVAVLALLGAIRLGVSTGEDAKRSQNHLYKKWFRSAIPFLLLSSLTVLNSNVDIILLGWMSNSTNVASFKVATVLVGLLSIALITVGQLIAPHLSRLYAENKMSELQAIVKKGARLTFSVAILALCLLLIFGEKLINNLYGNEYSSAYNLLVILTVGQVVSSLVGCVGVLLNMTNQEKYCVSCSVLALCLNFALDLVLIPKYGGTGAAMATSLSLAIWNLALWYVAVKKLRINSSL